MNKRNFFVKIVTMGLLVSSWAVAAEHTRNSETDSAAIRCGEQYPSKNLPSDQVDTRTNQSTKARAEKA